MFFPLLGWDRAGYGLGLGGGFYDRTLAGVKGQFRVGLDYDCQRLEVFLPDPWDVPMDYVVTELTVNDCRG